jgi:ribosome-associated protein
MKKKTDFLLLARRAAKIADDKKGKDIALLNVKRLTAIADYLLLVTVESAPQMNAVLDAIHSAFRDELNILPLHREGRSSTAAWSSMSFPSRPAISTRSIKYGPMPAK